MPKTPLLGDVDVRRAVSSHDLLRGLDGDALEALLGELEPVQVAAGGVLCRQGDCGDAMYLLLSGRLAVRVTNANGVETTVDELAPGATLGEMALLTGHPRVATVVAMEASGLVRLERSGFERLAEQLPALVERLARAILPLLQRSYLADVLTGLFGELDVACVQALQAQLEWQHLASGEVLFRQDDPGDALYVVVQGRLRVVQVDDGSGERVLRELGPGDTVGEMALLADEVRSATVYAVRASNVVRLSRQAFEELVQRDPSMLLRVSRVIVNRTRRPRHAASRAEGRTTCIALVPISGQVPLAECSRRLLDAMSLHGSSLLLDAHACDSLYGRPGAAHWSHDHPLDIALGAWLDEQERHHRFLLCAADGEWSPWTRRCVERADAVLLLAEADADPMPGRMEAALATLDTRARVELMLLHPDDLSRPRGTQRWLEPRTLAAHHHVRLRSTRDYGHVARRLAGCALGLVLGGGGARGLAHIGVWRALLEAGWEVDVVGGTSMGAIVAGFVAMGRSVDEARGLCRELSSARQVLDLTLPAVSFFASARVTRTLQGLFGDVCIEDLWRPFFCVSSNLAHAVQSVHRGGPLWRAVRASIAIPGIFSPLLIGDDLYVDGAVLNNLPIDVMRGEVGSGKVVAVNVFPAEDVHGDYRIGPSVSGWRALLSQVNPLAASKDRAPWIFETLLRAVALNDVRMAREKRALADLYLEPSVERFGILEFGSHERIIEAGYRAGRRAVAGSLAPVAATVEPPGTPLHALYGALAHLEAYVARRVQEAELTRPDRDRAQEAAPAPEGEGSRRRTKPNL